MKLIDLAAKLVSFDTVSKNSNAEMADFLSNYLEKIGFKVSQYPYTDKKSVQKINLIARKGGEESFLALSGHMDTVPYEGNWGVKNDGKPTNPLELIQIGQNFYARGIADMKLFLAIAMKAGEIIGESELKKPFALCFTADEEIGCVGAKNLVRKTGAYVGKYVVIGEPTEMVPLNAHKGYVYFSVNLEGASGHSSDPRNGTSVIPALHHVLGKLLKIEKALNQGGDSRFYPSYPSLNIGIVNTNKKKDNTDVESAKNMFAGNCRLEVEVRTLPGQSGRSVFEIIKSYLGENFGEVRINTKYERFPTPAMETSPDSLIVKTAMELSGKNLGVANFNTEGGVFTKEGSECVIWGPGSISQAHKKNEFMHLQYFKDDIVETYATLIRRLCC